MPRQGKRENVTFKGVRLPYYPHQGGWRFAFQNDSVKGGWRHGKRITKQDCREAAHHKAVEIADGQRDIANLSAEQNRLCRQFLDLNPTRADIKQLRKWKKFDHAKPLSSP